MNGYSCCLLPDVYNHTVTSRHKNSVHMTKGVKAWQNYSDLMITIHHSPYTRGIFLTKQRALHAPDTWHLCTVWMNTLACLLSQFSSQDCTASGSWNAASTQSTQYYNSLLSIDYCPIVYWYTMRRISVPSFGIDDSFIHASIHSSDFSTSQIRYCITDTVVL